MSNDNVVKLIQPGILTDRLTEVLRDGARALLTQAVEAEVSEFLAATADLKTDGCRRIVRHGHLPERQIMTGIGPVAVRQPRVRDRVAGADDPARIRFTPAILPPYARRSKSLDTLIPILYLKGVSTGDFASALAALLGKDAPGLSATTIARLKEVWTDEHKRWSERDLSAKSYVYVWAGGAQSRCRRVWRTRRNASWSSSAPRRRARRSCSALSTARERALTTGAPCCSISSAGVCRWRPSSPSPMARSASGRRSASSGPRPVSNDAGCIRPPTFSTNCPRASSPRPSACCKTFGWPKRGRTPRRRSTSSGLIAAIGNIARFKSPQKLVSYFGLNPRVRQSGLGPAHHGRISKVGRSHARAMLVEAAWAAAKTPGPLHAFFVRIRAKRGHQVAAVAVARKLAVLVWRQDFIPVTNPIESTFATVRHRTTRSKGCLSNMVVAVKATPSLLRAFDQLEHHGKPRLSHPSVNFTPRMIFGN